MVPEQLRREDFYPPNSPSDSLARRSVASFERDLAEHRSAECGLRESLANQNALVCEKDELIRQQGLLSLESDHRLLNGLQMIASLLSLQSREESNVDAASHLAVAANRVTTITRVHRRLHSLDDRQTVPFRHYLDDLCGEYSRMLASEELQDKASRRLAIVVSGTEVELPSSTAVPLSLIVNELITNALKHGKGAIAVTLGPDPVKGHALSVFNEGSVLPADFDPADSKGLGMRILSGLVRQIGGELRIDRGEKGDGTRFTVLLST